MTLNELKQFFVSSLISVYSKEEVESFFFMLSESWLELSRLDVTLNANSEIFPKQKVRFQEAISRLLVHEPIQYIIGYTEFYGLQIGVSPHTLIPRPETEELVDWILKEQQSHTNQSPKRILDIGTGSGCIAIALAKHLQGAEIAGLDISEEALNIAKQNAVINHVEVFFFRQDILKQSKLQETYDIIVSNPPYVRNLEKELMKANVLKYEPLTALFVPDEDPLVFYRIIGKMAMEHLAIGGHLFLEINEYLGKGMVELLKHLGFSNINMVKDFRTKDRFIKCTKRE